MISAIILAAGQSNRMGQPKMLLPWRGVTVIEHVISVFAHAGIEDIFVITGGARDQVEAALQKKQNLYPVRVIYNEGYERGEMLSSIQCGLRALAPLPLSQRAQADAAMIGLGDQPQVEEGSVRQVIGRFIETGGLIVAPSYQMRRGHPWLAARSLWDELLALSPDQTPRDFLNAHANDIHYVEVDTPSILADLDTPEDYWLAQQDERRS